MSARLVRGVVLVVCGPAIGGLIATSIADDTDAAVGDAMRTGRGAGRSGSRR